MFPQGKSEIYIIAEVGSVHDGSFGNACNLIDVASDCGADAVKFQTHISEAETLHDAPMPSYFTGENRFDYFNRTAFDIDQWRQIKARCREKGIDFISSPFSVEAVKLLDDVGVDRYKIPSGEMTNTLLLDAVSKTGRPVILSSGMSSWAELDVAVRIVTQCHKKVALLQCTSEYPCSYEKVGLQVLEEFKKRYSIPIGLSDHTLTSYASLAAVTLGAEIIERHITFSRLMYGSDARHSMEPEEFKDLVQGIRAIQIMLQAPVDKDTVADELQEMKNIFEKSVVSLVDIPDGTRITVDMLGVKKPGTGLSPQWLQTIVGCRAVRFISKDRLISKDDFL
jgi:sialic acid synthase SpsE